MLRCRGDDRMKWNVKHVICEGVSWIHLADDRDMNPVMNIQVAFQHGLSSGRSDREGTEQSNCAMCWHFTVYLLKSKTWYSDHLSKLVKTASWAKVNSSLSTPWGHLGGHRGKAALILYFGNRWRWVDNFTPWSLYPRIRTMVPVE